MTDAAVQEELEEDQVVDSAEIPYSFAKKHNVLVDILEDGSAQVSCIDTPKLVVLSEIKRRLNTSLVINKLPSTEFDNVLRSVYDKGGSQANQLMDDMGDDLDLERLADEMPQTTDLLEADDDAPIIRLINALLTQAIRESASDIHLEAFEEESVVRFRVDGVLRDILSPRREMHGALVSRIKVMSKLDIAEKRLPQDGRMSLRVAEHPVDVRVSTLPTQHGERVVMRLLDKQSARLDLVKLGMPSDILVRFEDLISKPNGILLVTGPTGSGGLRSILRQDPDVVLVGEIRDLETAEISVQASLTGHLVLSTLHTNTAIGAVTRLVDMGVEPFLIASSLVGVLAQRLVRRLCPDCKKPHDPDESEIKLMGIEPGQEVTMFKPQGCVSCDQIGYRGRVGIYELVELDEGLRRLIHDQVSEDHLNQHARKSSLSLLQNGFQRVMQGETTVDEIFRVTQS